LETLILACVRSDTIKKTSENRAVKRFYYRCATSTCNPKRTKTVLIIQGQTITTNEVNSVHTHPSPSTLPIDSEINQEAKQMLSNGMNPSTVFKELVLQSQEVGVTN
jgi:hypothetical protein